jgi:ATP-dependent Lhr-like helicase
LEDEEEPEPVTPAQIGAHLFKVLRGSNNLVFPNSRREVERYTHLLNRMCEQRMVPNEFWPHHGSLSKEIRYETESALKQKEHPASAICTNTLELGIDIGAVKSVVQIGPAPAVASLRQRLGRSGRRKGEDAILRAYCIEDAIDVDSTLDSKLRLGTVKIAAQVSLLLDNWFEPPRVSGMHLSTLIQQLLSTIAQLGGAHAAQLFTLLCSPVSPFPSVGKAEFLELLRHLGEKDLIVQDSSGTLLPGALGERLVNHYSFYAAFTADEEFRLVAGGKTLGTIPVAQMLTHGQRILFAGKTWRVDEIDETQKTIFVTRTSGGVPPLFSGGGGRTHSTVRQRMREILASSTEVGFLDATASRFVREGRASYAGLGLDHSCFIDQGSEVLFLTWLGDSANEAIACMFIRRGFVATPVSLGIEVHKSGHSVSEVIRVLQDASLEEQPSIDALLEGVQNLYREKWDWALPEALLQKTYASHYLDIEEGIAWIRSMVPNI